MPHNGNMPRWLVTVSFDGEESTCHGGTAELFAQGLNTLHRLVKSKGDRIETIP